MNYMKEAKQVPGYEWIGLNGKSTLCDGRTGESFHQDVAIWNNKCIIDNPLMCDGDGPIHMVRKWYSQFMTDRDQVREDQVRERCHTTVEGPLVSEVIAKQAS